MRSARDDEGFTLIELMMVVGILGVLIAIAIPHFLGVRHAAQDRAAHTDLRNVLLAQKMVWLEEGAYTADFAALEAVRPTSPLNADPQVGVFVDLNDADDQVACLVRASASGRVFSIWESASLGTHYGAGDLSVADCPAALPAGFRQGGF
ncbi:MAG: prepilin-type N-terminal cleavage/methylation domain-containing protein [Actinobacteria bacterium]|nr:prepilin-type N-terminal cleavage/methylation domain-containing protein [Actinomycetota bacterium]